MSKHTKEEFKREMEAITDSELVELANNEVTQLCSTRGRAFVMSVPPRITDTDILFSELIRRFEKLIE